MKYILIILLTVILLFGCTEEPLVKYTVKVVYSNDKVEEISVSSYSEPYLYRGCLETPTTTIACQVKTIEIISKK